MPNIKVESLIHGSNTEMEEDYISNLIKCGKLSEAFNEGENPSHITIVYGLECSISELYEYLEIRNLFKHLAINLPSPGGMDAYAFFGKKPADDQIRLVCSSPFMRDNCVSYVRCGKNKGSEHYNTYKIRQVVQLPEDND
ncbi:MAG: hypothetical protein ACI9TY_000948 [Alphaproteobacteria bacterium]|jgi:hypothetical protein